MPGSTILTLGPKSGWAGALSYITVPDPPLRTGAADAPPARAKIATIAARIEKRPFVRIWAFLRAFSNRRVTSVKRSSPLQAAGRSALAAGDRPGTGPAKNVRALS